VSLRSEKTTLFIVWKTHDLKEITSVNDFLIFSSLDAHGKLATGWLMTAQHGNLWNQISHTVVKVVQQHMQGVVGSLITTLLHIYWRKCRAYRCNDIAIFRVFSEI